MGENNAKGGDATGNENASALNTIMSTLTDLKGDMGSLKTEISSLREENKNILMNVSICEANLQNSLDKIRTDVNSIAEQNSLLKKENAFLKSEVAYLRQQINSNTLKVSNVPVTDNENLVEIFLQICNLANFEIKKEAISDCFRLKNRSALSTPLIIVKFVRILDKKALLRHLKEKATRINVNDIVPTGTDLQIYISEYLSPENASLFKEARILKKNGEIKHAWTRNGKIFVRKSENSTVKKIFTKSDLQKLNHNNDQGEDEEFHDVAAGDFEDQELQGTKKNKRRRVTHHDRSIRPKNSTPKINTFFRSSTEKHSQ